MDRKKPANWTITCLCGRPAAYFVGNGYRCSAHVDMLAIPSAEDRCKVCDQPAFRLHNGVPYCLEHFGEVTNRIHLALRPSIAAQESDPNDAIRETAIEAWRNNRRRALDLLDEANKNLAIIGAEVDHDPPPMRPVLLRRVVYAGINDLQPGYTEFEQWIMLPDHVQPDATMGLQRADPPLEAGIETVVIDLDRTPPGYTLIVDHEEFAAGKVAEYRERLRELSEAGWTAVGPGEEEDEKP